MGYLMVVLSVLLMGRLIILASRSERVCANGTITEISNGWFFDNGMLQAFVSRMDGGIKWINHKPYMVNALDGDKGAFVAIKFPNEGQMYLTKDAVVENAVLKTKDGQPVLELTQRIPGTELTVISTYTVGYEDISWYVEVRTKESEDREVQIQHRVPVSKDVNRYFVPGFPSVHCFPDTGLDVVKQHSYEYRRMFTKNRGLSLPLLTAYNEDIDIGLSFIQPLTIPKPSSWFRVNTDDIDRLIGVSIENLRLNKHVSARSGIHMVIHDGDWRPGLGWMLKNYSEYFRPANKEVYRWEGNMMIAGGETVVELQEKGDVDLIEMGIKFIEVPTSDCITDGGEWHTKDGWHYGRHVPDDPNDVEVIQEWNKAASRAKEYGIGSMFYFQNVDILREVAEERFPDAIAEYLDGVNLMVTNMGIDWTKTYILLNVDPKYSFYDYMVDQAERLMQATPEGVGIFWDRASSDMHIDFAHDDGISMQFGKKVYHLAFAQEKLMKTVRELANKYNKVIWVNQSCNIELGKYYDGVAMETWEDWLMILQYIAIARPLVYLRYWQDDNPAAAQTAREREDSLKACLITGAFAKIDELARTGPTMEGYEAFMKYVPLMNLLKQREWVLDAHALTLPDAYKGNIFTTPEHDYIVSIISPDVSYYDKNMSSKEVLVRVRVGVDFRVKDIYSLSADYEGRQFVEYEHDDEYLYARISKHKAASMLVIDGESVKGVEG